MVGKANPTYDGILTVDSVHNMMLAVQLSTSNSGAARRRYSHGTVELIKMTKLWHQNFFLPSFFAKSKQCSASDKVNGLGFGTIQKTVYDSIIRRMGSSRIWIRSRSLGYMYKTTRCHISSNIWMNFSNDRHYGSAASMQVAVLLDH